MHAVNSWFVLPRPLLHASRRLVCLAHAGAGASIYMAWAGRLAAHGVELCAIQYPGRENRAGETPIDDAREMVRQLADHWPAITGGRRCVLFGHSMGCLLSHELVLELARRKAQTLPECVLLSGRHPPHRPNPEPAIHALADHEFLAELQRRYGVLPAELLADPEMRSLIVSVLKNDFRLVETYALSSDEPLHVPLVAFRGDGDRYTDAAGMGEWQRYSRHALTMHRLRGDHFFHQSNLDDLLPLVVNQVLSAMPRVSAGHLAGWLAGADGTAPASGT